MKLKTRIASIAVGLAVAAGAIVTASPATAATFAAGGVTTQGLNVCHTEYRTKNTPICWFTPSNPACRYAVQVCTRY